MICTLLEYERREINLYRVRWKFIISLGKDSVPDSSVFEEREVLEYFKGIQIRNEVLRIWKQESDS